MTAPLCRGGGCERDALPFYAFCQQCLDLVCSWFAPASRRHDDRASLPPQLPVRITSRIDQSNGPRACWLWTGPRKSKGYGTVWWKGRMTRTHRLVLEASLRRSLTPDEEACHRCDNPPCCNPAHLFAGTRASNTRDMYAKGRGRPHATHCHRGHELPAWITEVPNQHRRCVECRALRYLRPSTEATLRVPLSPSSRSSAGGRSTVASGG